MFSAEYRAYLDRQITEAIAKAKLGPQIPSKGDKEPRYPGPDGIFS